MSCMAGRADSVSVECGLIIILSQARFQVSYMQCGCPTPDETSVHRFVRLFRNCVRCRSQLQVDLHPEHLPATHPSAHNALLTFQTVGTGTFGKMHHASGKRKAERSQSRSPTPQRERMYKKSERLTQLDLDRVSPIHSPAMPVRVERSLPALLGPSLYGKLGSDLRYLRDV